MFKYRKYKIMKKDKAQKIEDIVESDIVDKIRNSKNIDDTEKQNFLSLIMYFTPSEIEELKLII